MKYKILIVIFLTFNFANAQKDIGNEEINITKEKQIEIQKANRIFDKVPPLVSENKDKKMSFDFFEKKPTNLTESKFAPNIISPISNLKQDESNVSYNNYFKLGVGNYGRLFGEAFFNSEQNNKFVWGISALHNSTKRGPIANENSGSSLNKIKFNGKYHQENYEIKLDLGLERRNYYFYGYDTSLFNYPKADLRQIVNLVNANVTLDNTNPNPVLDYTITTGIKSLKDHYHASEIDWGTKFYTYFPVVQDKIIATVNAEAYLTQRSDNFIDYPIRKRNLYRVEPAFMFDFGHFSAKLGFKAVNQYDQINQINNTKGYPTASVMYKTSSLMYFFAGFDGDIIRNTLHSFINENPFIMEQINLLNTYKNKDFYVGTRGDLFSGLTYNLKASMGQYSNMYYFTKYDGTSTSPAGMPISTTKFQAEYESGNTKFTNVSAELAYAGYDFWKPNIKADYYYYQTKDFKKPFGRPNFVGRWGNTFVVSEKLIANLDCYVMTGLWAKDTESTEPIKLKNITDLNAEITYLFSKQFSTFVKLNNILGKNYQQYYNYTQLGLNFMAGINMSL